MRTRSFHDYRAMCRGRYAQVHAPRKEQRKEGEGGPRKRCGRKKGRRKRALGGWWKVNSRKGDFQLPPQPSTFAFSSRFALVASSSRLEIEEGEETSREGKARGRAEKR